ncbi:hypothetical protein H8B09_19730 [Paenibacillus sp. PR3]|uniref:Uncharacterized protein n=1 Tax=Paenibacillus terricola TaxID=2763503 RepID=A0ABR8N169_9BACL|nr:hypothetical protein [Paenibacillus terricola]MBD3921006.1 hypothetical protein [Paenibacillus terricola]
MLFQMCYGPELEVIYKSIKKAPGIDVIRLCENYQYSDEGDISSLIESALVILEDLKFIRKDGKGFVPIENVEWNLKMVFVRLQQIAREKTGTEESMNYIFASLYEQIFVKPDKMFSANIHYQVNSKFSKTLVGHEKVNAWKRIMECWGLGQRAYSGFYALPQITLIQEIIEDSGEWEGGLHPFCEKYIDPVLPCITLDGNIFKGIIFSLIALHEKGCLRLSYKQDLPYKSYGSNNEWNWIKLVKKVG